MARIVEYGIYGKKFQNGSLVTIEISTVWGKEDKEDTVEYFLISKGCDVVEASFINIYNERTVHEYRMKKGKVTRTN